MLNSTSTQAQPLKPLVGPGPGPDSWDLPIGFLVCLGLWCAIVLLPALTTPPQPSKETR
jgi:hypothetical protein